MMDSKQANGNSADGQRIFLVGYMGAGKTTLGKALAKAMGCSFCDLDDYIEEREHRTISEIFAQDGEQAFRQIEQRMLHEVGDLSNAVIAVGGGTPCFFDNIDFMNQHGTTVYLKGSVETLAVHIRMGQNKRPLVAGKNDEQLREYISQSLAIREPFYAKANRQLTINPIYTESDIQSYVAKLMAL